MKPFIFKIILFSFLITVTLSMKDYSGICEILPIEEFNNPKDDKRLFANLQPAPLRVYFDISSLSSKTFNEEKLKFIQM